MGQQEPDRPRGPAVFRFELDVAAETLVLVTANPDGYEGLERNTSVGPNQDRCLCHWPHDHRVV